MTSTKTKILAVVVGGALLTWALAVMWELDYPYRWRSRLKQSTSVEQVAPSPEPKPQPHIAPQEPVDTGRIASFMLKSRGYSHMKKGEHALALKFWRKAAKLRPSDKALARDLAALEKYVQEHPEALQLPAPEAPAED